MNISLTPEQEAMVREKIEGGRYNDSSEVVHEALRLLDQQEKREQLRAAISIGKDEIARGEGMEVTPELWAEIDREVDERIQRGDLPSADVCP